jgi:hypothetical protein
MFGVMEREPTRTKKQEGSDRNAHVCEESSLDEAVQLCAYSVVTKQLITWSKV